MQGYIGVMWGLHNLSCNTSTSWQSPFSVKHAQCYKQLICFHLLSAGSVLQKGSSSHAVMAVSGFDWGRLLKPDQALMPFFADMLPSTRGAPHVHAAPEAVSRPRTATAASEDLLSKVRAT